MCAEALLISTRIILSPCRSDQRVVVAVGEVLGTTYLRAVSPLKSIIDDHIETGSEYWHQLEARKSTRECDRSTVERRSLVNLNWLNLPRSPTPGAPL